MPDETTKGKNEELANNSPPAETAPKTGGDAPKEDSGGKGGGFMSELVDGVKGLFKSDSGGQNASGKEAESESAESDKGSGESAGKGQESKGSKLKEVAGQIVKGAQEAFENAKNEEKGDASLAEQMKELNEVQVDKAFVSDSINLLGTLSFDKLIGNPLRAAIKAQRDLAKETLSYIREEGMKVDEDGQGQITYVSMTFLKDGKQVRMRVPLLTLMPVPRLSITTMNYTFKAKVDAISSVVASVGSGGSPINSSFATGGNRQPAAATKPASAGADSQKAAAGKPTETKKTDAPAAAPAVKPTGSEPKVTSAPTMTTSYSSKKDSGATRDSRYSVETTIDVNITASEGEMPCGISKLLGVLDASTEVIDPKGSLQLSTEQASLVNGYAAVSVAYRDGQGTYKPKAVKCIQYDGDKSPSLLQSGDEMLLVFNEKGTYKVSAGTLQRIVFVS